MLTDLFAVASGISGAAVASAIPPGCRRGVLAPPAPAGEGGDVVVEFPEWQPRHPARHLLPSLALMTSEPYGFRFEASARRAGTWSSWIATAPVGPAAFAPMPARGDAFESDVDVFLAAAPIERVRLRLRLSGAAPRRLLEAPWLVTLSASDLAAPAAPAPVAPAVRLAVPPRSQMEEAEAIRLRICSPVSVGMVLDYWQRSVDLTGLLAEMYQPGLDRYGVWPAAVAAAARRGLLGYLLRFPDWASAAWCLARGVPIIASVRYGEGELRGAAIARTDGHLLVLTGYEGGEALVNDPAAASHAAVPRRYPLADLARVWLERSGVGYVLFRPASDPR